MKKKHISIVVLAMAAVLFLPLASNADIFWDFYYPQVPFPNATGVPAISVGAPGAIIPVVSGGFTLTVQAIGASVSSSQLATRQGSDENGIGVGNGTYVEGVSNGYEVNDGESIKVVFPNLATIPGAASEHLFFNSLEGGDIASIWVDAPFVAGNLLGTVNEFDLPEPHNFTIPTSAFGHNIFVTGGGNNPLGASSNDILLNSAEVDQVPEPGTLLLLGSGLIGLAGLARKKFKK